MKWQVSILAVLATLAVAFPQNQGSAQGAPGNQVQGAAGQKGAQGAQGAQGAKGQGNKAGNGAAAAAANVNAKANNGADGIKAAAKVDAAVLLANAGDPGAKDAGPEFEAAVKKIAAAGKQADIDTLKAAGVDVDAVLGGANNGQDNGKNNGDNQAGAKAPAKKAGARR